MTSSPSSLAAAPGHTNQQSRDHHHHHNHQRPRSKSPTPASSSSQHQQQHQRKDHQQQHAHRPARKKTPPRGKNAAGYDSPKRDKTPPPPRHTAATMTVLLHRVDLYDSGARPEELLMASSTSEQEASSAKEEEQEGRQQHQSPQHSPPPPGAGNPSSYPRPPVSAFTFVDDNNNANGGNDDNTKNAADPATDTPAASWTAAVCRVVPETLEWTGRQRSLWMQFPVVDTSVPNPFEETIPSITKYWNQRRRLFSKFDQGIQLDEQGWYSVTPEQIADHVSMRTLQLCSSANDVDKTTTAAAATASAPAKPPRTEITVLDAFCGCGGNAIAFAKHEGVKVVAVDLDRSKLCKAAHNAAIYGVRADQLMFVECNALFLLEHCFRGGQFILDQPIESPEAAAAMMAAMPPPAVPEQVAGFAVGGIDMLPRAIDVVFMDPPWGGVDYNVLGKNGYDLQRNMKVQRSVQQREQKQQSCQQSVDGIHHDFFDTFVPTQPRSKQERKAAFNNTLDEAQCVDGADLLRLAAHATAHRWVVYDVPRNTNRISVANAALLAGYRGNCKLEEHYLNGRLKTVTGYFGADFASLVGPRQNNQRSPYRKKTRSRSPKPKNTNHHQQQHHQLHAKNHHHQPPAAGGSSDQAHGDQKDNLA